MTLTPEIVAFLMQAVLSGRLDRRTVHALVAPWIEDIEPTAHGALGGATILHGLDLVAGSSPGSVRHAREGERDFLAGQPQVEEELGRWLEDWRRDRLS